MRRMHLARFALFTPLTRKIARGGLWVTVGRKVVGRLGLVGRRTRRRRRGERMRRMHLARFALFTPLTRKIARGGVVGGWGVGPEGRVR